MDKPNFKENKEAYKRIKEINKKVNALIGASKVYEKQARRDAETVRKEQIDSKLRDISIDELSKARLGIRVSALKKHGYRNIYELVGKSYYSLTAIPGIGETSARGIITAVEDIVNNVERNTTVKIDNNRRTPASSALVRDLFLARKLKGISNQAERFLEENEDSIKAIKDETLPARSWVVWVLTPEDKKKHAVERFGEVIKLLEAQEFTDSSQKLFEEEQAALKASHKEYWDDYVKNAASYVAALENIQDNEDVNGEGRTATERIAEKNGLPDDLAIAISKVQLDLNGLSAELRRYQRYGVQYILNQGAVLLGDEMGLGKTIEAIATMVSLRNNGSTHFFVVCPASVLINWSREIHKFSDLKVTIIHGSECRYEMQKWVSNGGVGVTTYETLGKIGLEADFKYSLLVVDEAHYIKNPRAARTKNLMFFRQHTDRALFMTGTPIENNVEEMCFLIGCLQPSVAKSVKGSTQLHQAPDFRRKVSGVYFRRTKEDVLDELPSKVENEEWCSLVKKEHDLYANFVGQDDFMSLRQVSWLIDNPAESSKGIRLRELVDEAVSEDKKVIVYSFFINTMKQAQTILRDFRCFGPITGAIAPSQRQEIIDQFSEAEGGAVLLSQIQAGGTGLNIQAASVIIFCEPQFKPSIENQAIARAYRMGQVNTVFVHRLLCEKTVDEQIMNILSNKQNIFDNFADISESGKESLIDSGMIKTMLSVEKERVQRENNT